MDEAHDWTDKQIEALQRKFGHVYSEAAKDMREKLEKHLEAYEKGNAEWQKLLASGQAKQKDYDKWLYQMTTDRKFMSGMVNRLSEDATSANQKAIDLINDRIPRVYAENANHAAYQVEKGLGWDTHSFDLYDESTVRRLLTATDQDQIIHEVIPVGPPRPKWQDLRVDLDRAKDVRWNRQKFTSAITQSILQGESVPNTAKRLMRVLNMDRGMATRAARTAMTSAENAGRIDSYKRAKRIGIDLEQEWMATLDERTRHSHRQLDGQHVPVGEKFEVEGHEIEFPGDPKAHPSMTYNCRCTLVAWFPGIEQEDPKRWSRLPKGMSYEEWKSGKLYGDDSPTARMPTTLRGYGDHATEYLQSHRDLYKLSDSQMGKLRQMVGKMVDNSEIYSYVTTEAIEDVASGGRLKSAIEMGRDEYTEARREQTRQLFGADPKKVKTEDFEKYGFFGSRDVQKVLSSGTNAQRYGDVCVQFKKAALLDRTTYTFGDSFNEAQRSSDIIAGGLADNLNVAGIQPADAKRAYKVMKGLDADGGLDATVVTQKVVGKYGYIEAQMHGTVSANEIEAVFIKCSHVGGEWVPDTGGKELLESLRGARFKVKLVDALGRIVGTL